MSPAVPGALRPCQECGSTDVLLVEREEEQRYFVRCRACRFSGRASADEETALRLWGRWPLDVPFAPAVPAPFSGPGRCPDPSPPNHRFWDSGGSWDDDEYADYPGTSIFGDGS